MNITSTAAKHRADRLEQMARAAITQYNADMAKGGEPLFPDWSLELLGLITDYERVLGILARQRLHIVDCHDFDTGHKRASVVQVIA